LNKKFYCSIVFIRLHSSVKKFCTTKNVTEQERRSAVSTLVHRISCACKCLPDINTPFTRRSWLDELAL